jgi:hypothetical protein
MMNGKIIKIWLILCLVVCLALPVFSVPMAINVQGRLTGDPLSGAMILRIYEGGTADTVDSGTLRWEKSFVIITTGSPLSGQILVDPTTRIFNVNLGKIAGADPELPEFLAETHYLQITVRGEILLPRQRLVSVPFAITAKNLKWGIAEASGETAVKGAGLKVGGSFESTAAGSIALKGVTTASDGLGVHGQGTSAGGSFESSGANGYGLWSTTGDTARAGIFTQNTGGGTALELGPGGIKLLSAVATVEWRAETLFDGGKYIHGQATANAIVGTIRFPSPTPYIHRWIGVNNTRLKLGDKMFFCKPYYIFITDYQITSNGKLWIEIYPNGTGDGFIQFLVIE